MGFWDNVLDVLSAPARLFKGTAVERGVKKVFGSETGSLTPALSKIASASSVADKEGKITGKSLLSGVGKSLGAIADFAEKEVPAGIEWAEKNLDKVKAKVKDIPIVGAELESTIGQLEAPLKEVSGLVSGAQEVLGEAKVPVSTLVGAGQQALGAYEAGKGAVQAIKRRDIGSAFDATKEAITSAQRAVEIGKMGKAQASGLAKGLGERRLAVQQPVPRFTNMGATVSL